MREPYLIEKLRKLLGKTPSLVIKVANARTSVNTSNASDPASVDTKYDLTIENQGTLTDLAWNVAKEVQSIIDTLSKCEALSAGRAKSGPSVRPGKSDVDNFFDQIVAKIADRRRWPY
jgi:hypothetical protein